MPEEARALAVVEPERRAVDGLEAPEGLGQARELDGALRRLAAVERLVVVGRRLGRLPPQPRPQLRNREPALLRDAELLRHDLAEVQG